jgi:hypothetical protein
MAHHHALFVLWQLQRRLFVSHVLFGKWKRVWGWEGGGVPIDRPATTTDRSVVSVASVASFVQQGTTYGTADIPVI